MEKVDRYKFLKQFPDFPTAKYRYNRFTFPEVFDSYVLRVQAGSTQGQCSLLAKAITTLGNELDFKELYFLGDSTAPWLYRNHSYKPVAKASVYLANEGITTTFNGAIKVSSNELSLFLKHLFWLVRCNGVVFHPHFTDAGYNIVANICQYGNLHISTLNEATDDMLNTVIAEAGFEHVDGNCGGYAIKGRQTAS